MSTNQTLKAILAVSLLLALTACPNTGGLKVTLEPTEAVEAGAQWQVDGGTWQESGTTVSGLLPGGHEVTFKETGGWYTPSAATVTIVTGETQELTQTYLPEDSDWAEDSFTCDVTLAPGVIAVEESQLDMLLEADSETFTYTFDAAAAGAAGVTFTAGEPLLIPGVAARRIVSAESDGSEVVVETEFIGLNEVFSDGEISWDYGVEFTPGQVEAIEVAGKVIYLKEGETVIDYPFTIGDYSYNLHLELAKESANLKFTIEKDVGGTVKGRFVAEGAITRFRNTNQIVFSGGELQTFNQDMTGMKGDVELELVVTASGSDAVNYKLPVPLLKIPFAVGIVPVELTVGAQFVINASVPADGSSRVTTGFTYDSSLGFSFNGVGVDAGGSLGGITFGEDVNETGASSAISANFGIGFPRIQVNIFGDTLVPWIQTAFLVGGSYTVYPACQTADAEFLGAAGFDLSILGFSLVSGSTTFFDETYELLRSGDCPEDTKTYERLDTEFWLMNDTQHPG